MPALGILNEDDGRADSHLGSGNEVTLEKIVDSVCSRLDTTIEEVRSDKRAKQLIQARTVMACLTRRLGTGSMRALGRHISRDSTSLAKLARKGQLDNQVQDFTEELLKELTVGDNL